MKFTTQEKLLISFYLFLIILVTFIFVGYVMNLFSIIYCDFQEPLKEEFLRMIGLIIPPLGGVLGYINF